MSYELKDKIHRLYEEAFNKGNLDVLDDIVSPEYVRHQPPMSQVKGIEDYKKFVTGVRGAYSGFGITVDEILVDGNNSAARITLQGKHTGRAPTLQAPPTGKNITMTGSLFSRWQGGKIVEDWAYNDYLGLVQQFGVVPPPGLY